MSIVSSEILRVIEKPNGNKYVMEQHIDQNGRVWPNRYNAPFSIDENAELSINAVKINNQLPQWEAEERANSAKRGKPEVPAQHQSQADLDRRTIAEFMKTEDSLEFSQALDWFRNFEQRAGANNNARATYLGVSSADYGLVADRFNQITGVKSGLEADAARVWVEALPGWE